MIRYEPDQAPPRGLALGLAAQTVALTLSGIVLTPAIVFRAGGVDPITLAWGIFAALFVSGISTIIQARPLQRIGAGYVLFMGTSGAFIAVSIQALQLSGLSLLMTLILAAALVEFLFAARLSALRRIVTPTVGGIAVMLIAVTVMPIAFNMLATDETSAAALSPNGAIAAFAATLLITVGLSFYAGQRLRLWAPLLGLVGGCAVAAPAGLIDLEPVFAAAWVGLPTLAWPGLDLSFGPTFWTLLPAFVIVTLVSAIETYGDGIAIQRISWRKPRAVDFRAVQGAINADGVGNVLSGLLGTLPNTTYSMSISAVEMTGVAARQVGVYGGLLLMVLAFLPKLAAVLLAVPGPVVAAYLIVLIALLFMHGFDMAFRDGITLERALIIGLSLWLGIGFQDQRIFFELLPEWCASLLSNGMTAGTLIALALTGALQLRGARPSRCQVPLDMRSLDQVQALANSRARKLGWNAASCNRLELAIEEAINCLVEAVGNSEQSRVLQVEIRADLGGVSVELVTGPVGSNLLNRVNGPTDGDSLESALSYRLLNAMTDRLEHQQFHDIDVLTLTIVPQVDIR
jgi:xanthine permease XanP